MTTTSVKRGDSNVKHYFLSALYTVKKSSIIPPILSLFGFV